MINLATEKDLDSILKIYDKIFSYQEKTVNYSNWRRGIYPTKDTAKQALKNNSLYIGKENGKVYGSMVLNTIEPKEYKAINFKYQKDKRLIIHTLCVSPEFCGKGKVLLEYAKNYAKQNGFEVIRLETYEKNIPAKTLYEKFGFSYAGKSEFTYECDLKEIAHCYEMAIE